MKQDLSLLLFTIFLILFTRCVFLISHNVYKQLTWAISHAILIPRAFILVEYLVFTFLIAQYAQSMSRFTTFNNFEPSNVLRAIAVVQFALFDFRLVFVSFYFIIYDLVFNIL